jgi:hypothetical protein
VFAALSEGRFSNIEILNNITTVIKLPPFPEEHLVNCKVFGDEWKQHNFSKQEVVESPERMLSEIL